MKKYAKIVNEETKLCDVGLGTDIDFYETVGMTETDVEQAYDGNWYVAGFAPEKPAPTRAEVSAERKARYLSETDGMMTEYLEALARGDSDAAQIGADWVAKKDEIRADLPYPATDSAQPDETQIADTAPDESEAADV